MVISLTRPRPHLALRLRSLSRDTRHPRATVIEPSGGLPTHVGSHDPAPGAVLSPSRYALDVEEGEPTWEDAEWQ